ncbi:MAG TPA: GNAT family N-acetyltransferase, partial [Solirubrobacteraceae bacterium]
MLVRDVLLRDGSALRLRAPEPSDFEAIRDFYDALSPESRYMRFHGFSRTDGPARAYAEADGEDRVALIGAQGGRIVAAAGYDRLREPGVAEIAFTVADDFQGRGAASRLLEQLAEIATEHGITRFDAEVLADNAAMLRVFRRAGFGIRRHSEFGEVTVALDLQPTEAVRERIAERDHVAAVASLRPFLAPASVAVMGAPDGLGGAVLANLREGGFAGTVTTEPPAELVVIAFDGQEALAAAERAAAHDAKALLVLSAGFDDEEEGRLLEIARAAGLRMIGPNCLGVLNTAEDVRLNATFAGARVAPGRLAICSQSGAVGIALLGHAAARRLGVSSFASLGNRADVSTNDLLELWEEDERTAAVMLYLETFGNPERFARIARRVSRRKPILAVKGRWPGPPAPAGRIGSHTAAALRGDAVVDALLREAGVLRFHSGDQLFQTAELFEHQPLPHGRRVGIVSNSAGLATLAGDACAGRELKVADTRVLGIQARAADYEASARELLGDPTVDALLACYAELHGGEPRAVLEAITRAAAGAEKPVVASVVGADGHRPQSRLRDVPNFPFPESCAGVLARAARRREWLSRPLGQSPSFTDLDPDAARGLVAQRLEQDDGGGWLSGEDAEALVATHGVPALAAVHCAEAEAAIAAAAALGAPIALKADFPPPAHAGDIDATLLGLAGEDAARAGWEELERRVGAAGREWTGATVQPLVEAGADVLVGAVADPQLGTVMAVGLGGRQAALNRSAAFRLPPHTDVEAGELIDASAAVATQLDGFRGGPALDREALLDLVLRFALLLEAAPEIVEADLNP